MNCAQHPDVAAVAYCRECGKPLCETCRRSVDGMIYCAEHAPVSPYTAPPSSVAGPDPGASPGLAFLLGLIPGVGAIYNGQYVKGLIHVVIFGILIGITNSDELPSGLEPLFGLLIAAWFFYMAFEAYHTAKSRRLGQRRDEFSGLIPLHQRRHSRFPAGPMVLIVIGVLFLLNNLGLLRIHEIFRYWPLALIFAGIYMLYARLSPGAPREADDQTRMEEVAHERRQI